jgi:hypothetical protein
MPRAASHPVLAGLLLGALLLAGCAQQPSGTAGAAPAVPGAPGSPPQTGGRY